MNRSNDTSRSLSAHQLRAALGDVVGPSRPDYLDDIVAQAGRMRQRPAWTFLERWLPIDIALRRQGVPRAAVLFAAVSLLAALLGAVVFVGSQLNRSDRAPRLGMFEPVAGRIVFHGPAWAPDSGYEPGLWAVDPSAPSVSTLLRLGPVGDVPLGWSSDGTKLLFMRDDDDLTGQELCCPDYLFIRRADGALTQLNTDPVYTSGATISPDGSRIAFAAGPYRGPAVLFVIDAEGGQPVRIAEEGQSPTFSPDGTRIAYVSHSPGRARVWVANADGSAMHEILADEAAMVGVGASDLAWSPAGDRIAVSLYFEDRVAIYTFTPDGLDVTEVISGGMAPYWSPDGSQIAYTLPDGDSRSGLGIANADGSNVREFDFGMAGPWHPAPAAAGSQ